VRRRVRKGIPPQIRPQAYALFCPEPPLFEFHCSEKSEHDIGLDIPRTFGDETPTKNVLEQVRRILKGLACQFPEVGYIQGMNYWIYRLVESVGFGLCWRVACALLRLDTLRLNLTDVTSIERNNFVLRGLVEEFCPEVNEALDRLEVSYMFFTPAWFLTLFSKCLDYRLFFRVMDCLLYDGFKNAYRAALALLLLKRADILEADST
jgi:hypothetical protein